MGGHGGGALSIPTQLKSAVVADDGWKFVVADVAQLEPRCFAGMSKDVGMAKAAQASDLYQALVDAKAVDTRNEAKLGMLGAMYGATRGESAKIVTRMNKLYPHAFGLVELAARQGEHGDIVRTFLGRGSPRPDQSQFDTEERLAAGVALLATSSCRAPGPSGRCVGWPRYEIACGRLSEGELTERPHLVFFLHDEVMVHTPMQLVNKVEDAIRESAIVAGQLLFGDFEIDFPLDVSIVDNYGQAKG